MNARHWTVPTLLFTAIVCALAGAQAQSSLLAPFSAKLESERGSLVELRRDIHRHPETSGKEERTAGLVADRLRAAGYEVRTGIGGHGVVGVLRGGKPGPVVAYRADMDAVPSDTQDPVEFRSLTPGVRHICGHDVHVAIGVGLAAARAMLEAGLFATERPVAVFGLHRDICAS
jgi:metal-dependent amidase/aminoacylase/carboxypeptidase family protein